MPTKYDVFAEIIEHAPCSQKDLSFKTPVYAHLKSLIADGILKKEKSEYVPINNKKGKTIFKIIRYCLKNGLDYNILLSKNVSAVVSEIFRSVPILRPEVLASNNENTKIMNYLEDNQFIMITKKRPRIGIILKHQLFDSIKGLHSLDFKNETGKYFDLQGEVNAIQGSSINPFDDKIFEFLSGSAQLEGSTVTVGETRELILNDIYPDKPKKDTQMVKNLNEAMYYVLENLDKDITEEHIKKINEKVLFSLHRNAGKYKVVHNKIQGNPSFKTAKPSEVVHLMKNYCAELNKVKSKVDCLQKLGYIHNEIQHIHPFSDGNSRTTRMILNWMLLKHKAAFLVIKMGCFDEYMSLTKLGRKRDDKKLTKLFHHILLHEHLIN